MIIRKIQIYTRKRNVTKAEKREADRMRRFPGDSPILLILYLLGTLGVALAVRSFLPLDDIMFGASVAAVEAFSAFLWYVYTRHTKYFIIILGSVSSIFVIFFMMNMNELLYSGHLLQSSIFPIFMIMLAALIVVVLFSLEFVIRSHSIVLIMICALYIFGYYIGLEISLVSTILSAVFLLGFCVLNMTSKSPKKTFNIPTHSRSAALSAGAAAAALLLLFAPAFFAEKINEETIFRQVYDFDTRLQNTLMELSQNFRDAVSNGSVSRGNLHQTGKKLFTAETGERPPSRLYLKGYVGDKYEDSNWLPAFLTIPGETKKDSDGDEYTTLYYREPVMDDAVDSTIKDYYTTVLETLRNETGYHISDDFFGVDLDFRNGFTCYDDEANVLYVDSSGYIEVKSGEFRYEGDKKVIIVKKYDDKIDSMNINMTAFPEYPGMLEKQSSSDPLNRIYLKYGIKDPQSSASYENDINITPSGEELQSTLIPYYSERSQGEAGSPFGVSEGPYDNTFYYSGSISMRNNWDNCPEYKRFIESYYSAARKNYCNTDNIPDRLRELCGSTPLSSTEEITTFILYTLQTHASYSRNPGNTPVNSDTIDYFLFDNHRGYCVHFASAAVMMYRLYGIPARYVSGYAVETSAFTPDGSGSGNFTADVSDYSAHSWVEIFLKDYGWVPVEATPSETGIMSASYPGYDSSTMTRIMQQHNWKFRASSASAAGGSGDGFEYDAGPDYILICIIASCSLAVLSLIFLIFRRKYYRDMVKDGNCRFIFDRLIRMLHFSSLMKDMYGSENGFAEKLSESVPELTPEETRQLVLILSKDNYSKERATQKETEFVRSIYSRCSEYIFSEMNPLKKLKFLLGGFR